LKYSQSGHHASGLKPAVPAIGITSRCVQHSDPSSGGRRQRHERNFITAADDSEAPTAPPPLFAPAPSALAGGSAAGNPNG
jgi:hypothetical protein